MPHPRRLRFAVELHHPFPGRTWLESAKEVEQLGYSTVFLPDHFDEGPGPIAATAAFAAVTSTVNVGLLVLDCDFRHPVPLARELATIDVIAEGRLEVGLGAGWKRRDYDVSGIPMDRPGVRVSRLQEHCAVLRGLWADGPFSFAGEHYTVTDLDGTPAPHRPGGPPILVGGGAPRLLRWAGRTADIVGVNASIHSGEIDADAAADALAERIDEKVGWVREGAGDRFADLELNAWLAAAEVTEDAATVEAIASLFGTDAEGLRSSPLALVGAAGEIAERLHERRERWGYSYHVVPGDKAHALAPVVGSLAGT
ncbi:TIGR03621 family F420-dependent LLM class oxidoreductase [Iamia sp. SCSIO 61187]|uniref:TIGR03621 family F420-dependent LLM class oxidoreductase n=1 Tax=Iamia sp. SCSIO 61187 TaxID=2722752 RepID=UPI001C62DAD1|nr:TIGR03621 family F420-dependent LLM class oxidoreductase [Iamia sp. SCSIO 61187]QYG91040.1 TIGR03621 family F420-dependent LLM class oxidoreductase [Iamia sp. SCSIO 61187]